MPICSRRTRASSPGNVAAPTLMILGGEDRRTLHPNRWARSWMRYQTDLAIVPGATHPLEETGTLEQLADLATGWSRRWLVTEAGHAQF
jgi:putative phosphoribosyl transferase